MPTTASIGLLVVLLSNSAPADEKPEPTNRLAGETSPYLLQHAHNPVDWFPWGAEAFEKARKEGKPIFLSVGYSSCHWCHVMERESFSDEQIARTLNEHFVCIKVDREERPDVDAVYMAAVQAFQGSGGWPMSVFLFPDGRPFFGGTYFPPHDGENFEGFDSVLDRVIAAWRDHRKELDHDADQVAAIVKRRTAAARALRKLPLARSMADDGQAQMAGSFDPEYGGFGFDPDVPKRPKFPEATNLLFLLDRHRRQPGRDGLLARGAPGGGTSPLAMVETTLDQLARGGIRDHLAGGYHRYSTDRMWVVPHFEKMLYDEALIASTFLQAFEVTKDDRWRREAEATLDFVAREMTTPEGGFASAFDADAAGEEGSYYVWTREEVAKVLGDGDDARVFAIVYGLNGAPSFEEDRYVLRLPRPWKDVAASLGTEPGALEARLSPLRAKLLEARQERPGPSLDDKVIAGWNGLMIAAFADGFRVLKEERYRRTAEKAADFLLARLRDGEGGLMRSYRAGRAKGGAYLDDYAYLAQGLLRLHDATGERVRLDQARALVDRMIAEFADEEGGFYLTSEEQESLLARPKDPYDGALPSGNAVAVRDLLGLATLTGEDRYLDRAGQALEAFSPTMAQAPSGVPTLLVALQDYLDARPAAAGGDGGGPGADELDNPLGLPRRVLQAEVRLDPDDRKAGGVFGVTIALNVAEGWHITANPAGDERLRPTVVELATNPAVELVSVAYPEGEAKRLGDVEEPVNVYEGRVVVKARLRTKEEGDVHGTFRVRYQACNDRACLAPAVLEVSLSVAPGKK